MNKNEIVFEFETEEQRSEFLSWFLDGGGEYDFYSAAVELRGAIPPFTALLEGKKDGSMVMRITTCKDK